jgi:hypothetical protein
VVDGLSVARVVRDTLRQFSLAPAYPDEQKDLQWPLAEEIRQSLKQSFPKAPLQVTTSTGGRGKPRVELLGTSFWLDIEIKDGNTFLAAIEVKIVRRNQPASHVLAAAVGQGVVYSVRYPWVFVFIVHHGQSDDQHHEEDTSFEKRLSLLNIELILRRAPPERAPLSA